MRLGADTLGKAWAKTPGTSIPVACFLVLSAGESEVTQRDRGERKAQVWQSGMDVVLGVFSIKCSSDVMFHGFAAQVCELWSVSGLCLGDVSLN